MLRELSFLSGGGVCLLGGPELFGVVKGGPVFFCRDCEPKGVFFQLGGPEFTKAKAGRRVFSCMQRRDLHFVAFVYFNV